MELTSRTATTLMVLLAAATIGCGVEQKAVKRRSNIKIAFRIGTVTKKDKPGAVKLPDRDVHVLVGKRVWLTEEHIAGVSFPRGEPGDPNPNILIRFNKQGRALMAEMTKSYFDKHVLLYVSGSLVSAPKLQAEITGGEAQVTCPKLPAQVLKDLRAFATSLE